MVRRAQPRLSIKRFAQIGHADIEFGDLTVFVGPQATGKSLALQLFKLCIDGKRVKHDLTYNGFPWQKREEFLSLVFGEGMGSAWSKATRVAQGGTALSVESLAAHARKLSSPHELTYIPAQRALTIVNGWPGAFRDLPPGTPYVVRRFSEGLGDVLRGAGPAGKLFPLDGKLKEPLRDMINHALFHDATIELHNIRGQTELRLKTASLGVLPAMVWTAGQREFVPLLIALYALIPSGNKTKDAAVDWVVLEEPEMGLHPKGILAVMLLVLELLARGYKVILSTHHPLVLDVVWGLRRIQASAKRGGAAQVLRLFQQEHAPALQSIAAAALKKEYRVTAFDFVGGWVETQDISSLDPGSDDPRISGWGGLSGLSGHIGDVVAEVISR